MTKFLIALIALQLSLQAAVIDPNAITPQQALQILKDGNQRFINGTTEHPNWSAERREQVVEAQNPFAIIVGCADSRIPPEVVFDQGIGDLFAVRVAGNVVGKLESESIEFAAMYIGSPLILVMGHENCGAVTAVINGTTKDIPAIAKLIEPAVAQSKGMPGDQLVNATKLNVENMVKQLSNNPNLKKLIKSKDLQVIGAYYDLNSNKVEYLDN